MKDAINERAINFKENGRSPNTLSINPERATATSHLAHGRNVLSHSVMATLRRRSAIFQPVRAFCNSCYDADKRKAINPRDDSMKSVAL